MYRGYRTPPGTAQHQSGAGTGDMVLAQPPGMFTTVDRLPMPATEEGPTGLGSMQAQAGKSGRRHHC